MDVLDAIFGRRSIRSYTDEAVSEDDVKLLLKAAMFPALPSTGTALSARLSTLTLRVRL